MAVALAPLHDRMPAIVREQEILRIAAAIPLLADQDVISIARDEVLKWAQKRSGGQLPQNAWCGDGFEYFAGGRTTIGVRISNGDVDLWGLRGDDPDKSVARRVWTTEVTIGRRGDEVARLGVRLFVSTPEANLEIRPSVPGLMKQLVAKCGVRALDGRSLRPTAHWVTSTDDIHQLIDLLEDPKRTLPVIVASGDERGVAPEEPLIDVEQLAKASLGLAHVYALPASLTYQLSDAFGKIRSVFYGAIRVFMPGFDATSNPYDHGLILERIIRDDPQAALRQLCVTVAKESLRRTRLGHEVVPFATLRTTALEVEAEGRTRAGASDADQLETARERIGALEYEINALRANLDQYFDLAHSEEERAKAAEAQLFGLRARVVQLEKKLASQGALSEEEVLPDNWIDFAEWCDQALIGRLVLAPAARRSVKSALFQEPATAARCLLWLADKCRDRRIHGGGSLDDAPVAEGLWNSPCGADSFSFDFQGHRLEADWHVKNGGNTRDPARCLRIYYGWDPATQQIVVAEMPAHRRTGAT